MIFRRPMLEKVLSGEKTVTRRRGKARYKEGRVYAVQPGRGQFHVGHIRVVAVRQAMLASADEYQARREGFKTLAEFKEYWRELHGSYDAGEMVWAIYFELAPRCPDCPAEAP